MTFIEIMSLIALIVLAVIGVIFALNLFFTIREGNAKCREIYRNELLLLRIFQKYEETVKEKGIGYISGEDMFGVYMTLVGSTSSEEEIDESIRISKEIKNYAEKGRKEINAGE